MTGGFQRSLHNADCGERKQWRTTVIAIGGGMLNISRRLLANVKVLRKTLDQLASRRQCKQG